MPGVTRIPWLLAGMEGPPSLAMAASSAAILAYRVGSVVVSAFFILIIDGTRHRLESKW